MKKQLTPREKDVFNLILKGFNNIQISNKLKITKGTAKVISNSVLKKLGCNSKNEVMAKHLGPAK